MYLLSVSYTHLDVYKRQVLNMGDYVRLDEVQYLSLIHIQMCIRDSCYTPRLILFHLHFFPLSLSLIINTRSVSVRVQTEREFVTRTLNNAEISKIQNIKCNTNIEIYNKVSRLETQKIAGSCLVWVQSNRFNFSSRKAEGVPVTLLRTRRR